MNRDDLPMFVITANPSDFPGRHVVRRTVIRRGLPMLTDRKPTAVCQSLEEARAAGRQA